MSERMLLSASWGDHSTPAGAMLPWYRDENPEDCPEWAGWELCEEAAGLMGQERWAIYRSGQTIMSPPGKDLGPFTCRVISGPNFGTMAAAVVYETP